MDLWHSDAQRHKRSFEEMSHQATLSPSPVHNFTGGFFFSRSSPEHRRRSHLHPHNQPRISPSLQARPADIMADRTLPQPRPNLHHQPSRTITIDLTDDVDDEPPIPSRRMDRQIHNSARNQRPPQLGRSDAQALENVISLTDSDDDDVVMVSARPRPRPGRVLTPAGVRPPPNQQRDGSPGLFVPRATPPPPRGPYRDVPFGGVLPPFAGPAGAAAVRAAAYFDTARAPGPRAAYRFPSPAGMARAYLELADHGPRPPRPVGFDHHHAPAGLHMDFHQFHWAQDVQIGNLPGQMDYGRQAFEDRKPDHVAPPAAHDGFTRSPVGGDVVICPSCDEEMVHQKNAPDEVVVKKVGKTTRKDREEHPFWVLKECGHVYCNKCYQNRAGGSKVPFPSHTASFPAPAGLSSKTTKRICAVEDCESLVNSKEGWVGVFL